MIPIDRVAADRPFYPGKRANAQLKSWRILRELHCSPWRAGQLAKAIHVVQTREIARTKTPSLSALSSMAVQEVAECAADGNQRGGHQVDGHPGHAGEVARLVFDVGAGDGQSGEERHPCGRGQ